jgi:hypothetical protein
MRNTSENLLRGRLTSLLGARSVAYPFGMSRSLRVSRLASHSARYGFERYL